MASNMPIWPTLSSFPSGADIKNADILLPYSDDSGHLYLQFL